MGVRVWIVIGALSWAGCAGESAAPDETVEQSQIDPRAESESSLEDATLSATASDLGADGNDEEASPEESEGELDASAPNGDGVEAELSCSDWCLPAETCSEWTVDRCLAECELATAGGCGAECFGVELECEDSLECLGLEVPTASFKEGPYGTSFRDIAGPVVIPTTSGDWSFETYFDGNDNYVFLNTTANGSDFSNFVTTLWDSNFKFFLWEAPRNTHLFFMSFDASNEAVLAMETKVLESIGKLEPEEACWWRKRVHFVTSPPQNIPGWIGEMLSQNGWFGFAVDRAQRIRPLGLLQTVGGTPQLSFLAYELHYYNFEAEREVVLGAEEPFIVPVVEGEEVKNQIFDVSLPDPLSMANFNRLSVDLGTYCADHLDSNCGEWDYMSYLFACEIPEVEENPYAEEACQPAVAEIAAAEEMLGTCPDGVTPCSDSSPCPEPFECQGYSPAVDAVEGIEAETRPCQCESLEGEWVEKSHTCNGDGNGFGSCPCSCDTEIARWITTYGREGRWVTDITPMHGFFRKGNTVRLRLENGNPYFTELNLRFETLPDEPTPSDIVPLFKGGAYNAEYNEKYEPFVYTVPEDAAKIEIVAFISGHGFGVDQANCAEFCNHEHEFTVNGEVYSQDYPEAGDNFGCAKQVSDGTVPNQYGTWYLGRGGWCPGMDVPPVRFDVTSATTPGEEMTVSYRSLVQGEPYVPIPFDWGSGGFGALMRLTSYIVVFR